MQCDICGKQDVKNMGAHKRFCSGKPAVIAEPLPAPAHALDNPLAHPTAPLAAKPEPFKEKAKGRLDNFLREFKEAMGDKFTQTALIAQVLVLGLITAAFMGGVIYLSGQVLVEQPFFWLSLALALLLIVMRKDVGFNLTFFVLNKLKQNPRIVYHVDGSRVLNRAVVRYNPNTSSFSMGTTDVEVTPETLLTDGHYQMPCAIHVGAEKSLRNLFAQVSDYHTAKQVDLMVKNAEQLGELKSTERLDKLVQIAYVIAGVTIIGAVVSVLAYLNIGELTTKIDALIPSLQALPELVKNTLMR